MDDFDFNIDFFEDEAKSDPPEEITPEEKKKARRRTTRCTELSLKYEYRRAFSETKLLDCNIEFKQDHSYNFITSGDVDALSYLKLILRHVKKIDYFIFSTWCMSADDLHQF